MEQWNKKWLVGLMILPADLRHIYGRDKNGRADSIRLSDIYEHSLCTIGPTFSRSRSLLYPFNQSTKKEMATLKHKIHQLDND